MWAAPLLVPLLSVGVAASMWPLFDLFILPLVVRQSLEAPKCQDDDDLEENDFSAIASLKSYVEASQRAQPRQLIVLYGSGAELLSRKYVKCAEEPCGFVSFRNQWSMNPYEIGCLQHLGEVGAILNTYVKAVIFIGSVLSQRHPHTDTILYTHNVNNNMRRALKSLKASGQKPHVVLQHVDNFIVHGLSEECKESRACFSLTSKSLAEFSLSLIDDGLADVLWVFGASDIKALSAAEVASLQGRVRVLYVEVNSSSRKFSIRQEKPHRGMMARMCGVLE
eukprot:gnl/MRDRNA2_/MRDRNA2_148891_c0_seq1.p1 gnl/MRDRNA2_/MRDRNA2_148891_c0~~gnl/MRDRNA2_/MRDRNA2_148891_c0_seq1.p1  ORF type:complete len:301 (+),score=45.92 gnl/MRDRNA2_/MRDRNA2_148891_c0_seq1:64-903(+)